MILKRTKRRMITIHNEVTIDVGTMDDHPITLWLVSYGSQPGSQTVDYWPQVVEALRSFCARQGWLLECGDDPYSERSLAIFAGGFGWPPDHADNLLNHLLEDDDEA